VPAADALPPRPSHSTGTGGAATTSVAAATARRLSAGGLRTLIVSTDPAHSLGDVLEAELAPEPRPVGENLHAQQVVAQAEMERHWAAVQDWLGELLVRRGIDRISAEELTVPPGLDELFSLLEIRRHHDEGDFDALVVDCAPTGETLRLLSFPDVARWWLEKAFPQHSRMVAAARPFARALPDERVLGEVQRLLRNLIAMNEVLRDHERVSVRLVMTPEKLVIDEARRTFTYLSLYGFLTDAVIVNRVLPPEVDGYFGPWRERQAERMVEIEQSFAPVPLLTAPFFAEEVLGAEMLDRLADELFADAEAAAVLHDRITQELSVGAEEAELRIELPFARKGEITVAKVGLDLVVRVGGHKRTLALPPALGDYRPTGATFEDGALRVTFDREKATADA
jgi:arsenite-transporting ATPase